MIWKEYVMTVNNFKKYIRRVILDRGKEYFNSGRVESIMEAVPGSFCAKIKGTKTYDVKVHIDSEGEIVLWECNCPYDYGGPCKHVAALLLAIEERAAKSLRPSSSNETRILISEYKNDRQSLMKNDIALGSLQLIPLLHADNNTYSITYSLKIGTEKMYSVHDIEKLYRNFKNEEYVEYGKELAFKHHIGLLDERSRKLLDISYSARNENNERYYYNSANTVRLGNMTVDGFFELFRDDSVTLDNKKHLVKFEEPNIRFEISRVKDGLFTLSANKKYVPIGKGKRAYFLDEENCAVLASSPQYAQAVYPLYKTVYKKGFLMITEKDMTQFYNNVLKYVPEFAEIEGSELLDSFIPPEMTAQLYVDCGENNTVYADLMFCYGENSYNACDRNAPHYDEAGENTAYSAVMRYFLVCPSRDSRTLLVGSDDRIYDFIINGLPELSKIMELYISDKFRRMAVRPAAKPTVGVRVSGGLLELDISDDNYSAEELSEILKAYRAGVKYRRLKDGSFAVIDGSLKQFAELAENLDISDKALLKKKIKIPAYRMLYLDSLQNRRNIRLECDSEFKRAVKNYRSGIEDADSSTVPEELSDIMRDYQKYGFRWMKTIAAYKFGGILADDMGLGKTLQAISLMLDRKKCSKRHGTSLIVCPSSLLLNWESEIAKFAPELKTLVVMGTAAARSPLIEKIHGGRYDAVITSYSLLTKDIDKYEKIKFRLHFIDEAQYIKNHNTQTAKAVKAINSEVRFALTGTPVENSLAELWSAFDFIMPGYLFSYSRFKNLFEKPIVSKNDNSAVKALQSSVSPFILRRMKSEVLDELPDKTETVLTSSMEGEQRKLYAACVSKLQKNIRGGFGRDQKERIQILAELTRLRELCCDPALVFDNYKGKSAKLEQCAELVDSCVASGHKILLFSQFTSMLEIIAKRLEKAGISYYTLRGSTKAKDRIRMVNEFNENDVKVFLISLKAGGTGLNLTGADIVIHYDPWWNSSAENQASDRVYRIGQKNNVQIYKLIACNSIEEKILKLQQSKSEISNLVYGENADITKMSADEILELLK